MPGVADQGHLRGQERRTAASSRLLVQQIEQVDKLVANGVLEPRRELYRQMFGATCLMQARVIGWECARKDLRPGELLSRKST